MSDQNEFSITTAVYAEQNQRWPESGRHILAQYDEDTILVYQAYRPAIGVFAAKHATLVVTSNIPE